MQVENIKEELVKSATKQWKESGTTLPFKDWIERKKSQGHFIVNKSAQEQFMASGQDDSGLAPPSEKVVTPFKPITVNLVVGIIVIAGILYLYSTRSK
jgi:hypothetical protein